MWLMKDELGGKIMTEFVALTLKTYSYLMHNGNSNKKAKGTKKCVIKRRLKFIDYKDCLLKSQIKVKSQQRFKSEAHSVYTEESNYEEVIMIRDCKLLIELFHILMV